MANLTLRSVKGTPLTNAEVDTNFSNLNTEVGTKVDQAGARSAISATGSLSYNSTTGVISFTDAVTSVAGKTGAVTLSSADITTALGYTPYNSTNPSGYITSASSISGNAATATKLQTARLINGISFDGSQDLTITANTPNVLTRGAYLTGFNFNGNNATTWAVDATSANSASKVVARDASGNFSAGTITAALSGNATTATILQTGRTIGMTGDVTWTSAAFNGSANVTGSATLANSGVTAGTYTKITVDAKGRATAGATLSASDIPVLTMASIPGAAYKQSVRCATTANITLSGTQTIDGIAVVAGDRVLVKNQTTASQNGIYVVSAGAWTRSADADAADEIGASVVNVDSGTANGGELWTTTFKTTDTLGTTAMNWYEVVYNTGTWAISTTGSAATLTTGRTIGMTGDVTWTSGSFNGSANVTGTATLANSGVTAGTYTKVTVDTKGRVTTGASLASADLPTYTGALTSGQVTTALGFTPYNSTNPSGYITSSGSITGNAGTVTNGVYTTGDQIIGGSKTFSLPVRPPAVASSWINGHRGNSALSLTTTGTTASFHGWVSQRTPSGGFALGTLNDSVYLTWATNANIDAPTNTVFNALRVDSNGTVTATTFSGALSGNATTATTLQTARTISLTGDVTGSASFNGSANVSITATVEDDSHNHIISNVDGLQTALDARKINYNAIVRRASWSRIARFNEVQLFGSVMVTFQHTRSNVVVGNTFLVTFGHSNHGQLVMLGSHGYTQVQVRLTAVGDGNNVYMEIYDDGVSDGTDDNDYTVSLDNINCTPTIYTTYTAGSGTVLSQVTTVNNQINIDGNVVLDSSNYTTYAPTNTGTGASGTWGINVTGNAGTATTLQTARTINGTSFNGSANITTANWGTARTLSFTGDVTGSSSVNGSANVATAMTLANSGVTAGTYTNATVTVDAKGRVTSASSGASGATTGKAIAMAIVFGG